MFIWLLMFSSLVAAPAHSAELSTESEKDFSLRAIGQLKITHVKGDISIQSWALDKIRVKVKKSVSSTHAAKAAKLFDTVDYSFETEGDNVEISSRYHKDSTLEERFQEQRNPSIKMDIQVTAPSNLKLQIWAADGNITIKGWNADANIRAKAAKIRVEDFKADSLSVICSSCEAQLRSTRASLKCAGEGASWNLHRVDGKSIYLETETGQIDLSNIKGDQLYVIKKGSLYGQYLRGKIEFHSESAPVHFREVMGFLSGNSGNGNLIADFQEWVFLEKALIESISGNISLHLPPQFSGDVDIWALKGNVRLDFPLIQPRSQKQVTLGQNQHLIGRIQQGGELLKVFSKAGNIEVLRRKN
jgi:DUF4097 and DUF4098 domain-containing protein YvlB